MPRTQSYAGGWLKTRDRKKTYLVNITGHYIVVSGDKTIDNQSGEWHSVRKSKHRRKRVGYAWEIKSTPLINYLKDTP